MSGTKLESIAVEEGHRQEDLGRLPPDLRAYFASDRHIPYREEINERRIRCILPDQTVDQLSKQLDMDQKTASQLDQSLRRYGFEPGVTGLCRANFDSDHRSEFPATEAGFSGVMRYAEYKRAPAGNAPELRCAIVRYDPQSWDLNGVDGSTGFLVGMRAVGPQAHRYFHNVQTTRIPAERIEEVVSIYLSSFDNENYPKMVEEDEKVAGGIWGCFCQKYGNRWSEINRELPTRQAEALKKSDQSAAGVQTRAGESRGILKRLFGGFLKRK